jgi:hypothetical protein
LDHLRIGLKRGFRAKRHITSENIRCFVRELDFCGLWRNREAVNQLPHL